MVVLEMKVVSVGDLIAAAGIVEEGVAATMIEVRLIFVRVNN